MRWQIILLLIAVCALRGLADEPAAVRRHARPAAAGGDDVWVSQVSGVGRSSTGRISI